MGCGTSKENEVVDKRKSPTHDEDKKATKGVAVVVGPILEIKDDKKKETTTDQNDTDAKIPEPQVGIVNLKHDEEATTKSYSPKRKSPTHDEREKAPKGVSVGPLKIKDDKKKAATIDQNDTDAKIPEPQADTKTLNLQHDEAATTKSYSPEINSSPNNEAPLSLSESIDELAELEDTLADAAVSDVLLSLQTSLAASQSKGDTNVSKTPDPTFLPVSKSPAQITRDQEISSPVPSGKPNVEEPTASFIMKEENFESALHKTSKCTDHDKLLTLSSSSHILKLERTFYCFTKGNLLSEIVLSMKNLSTLDLRGGQCGPIGFRILANALMDDRHITELNLSDNLANPECSEILGKLLLCNSTLEHLNVSGNQLGKDALSRYVGASLVENSTLKSLNISGCGATDLHCLCESIRNSLSSALISLNASHNCMSDGYQFAIDISLLLETEKCMLKNLDVTNTAITPSGLNAIAASLVQNTSLESIALGQNMAEDVFKISELILNGCGHANLKELHMNKTSCEKNTSGANETVLNKDVANLSKVEKLGIADCGLNDTLVQVLATKLDGKLLNLQELDISNNNDLSMETIKLFDKICTGNLQNLKIGLFEEINGLQNILVSNFTKLNIIDLTRSRLSPNDIKEMCSICQQGLTSLTLNGIKLSGTGVVSALCSSMFVSTLSELRLGGCQLIDVDLEPLSVLVKNKGKEFPLRTFDLSVNRLKGEFVRNLTESLAMQNFHPLQEIDFSNNLIDGTGLDSLAQLLTTSSHTSYIKSVNFSCNDITAASMIKFFEAFKAKKFPLEYFDIRNQSETLPEEEAETLGKTLKDIFFGDESLSKSTRFVINFAGLGGSDVSTLCELDSSAIKTDFVNLRKPTLSTKDILEITRGLRVLNLSRPKDFPCEISSPVWKSALGRDAPAWAFVTSQLKNAAYFAHMPGTVTVQRLHGILEMEADCEVKDIFLVKDPIMRKPTGAAWVLFEDSASLATAIEWYVSGSAQMYGTPFTISEVSVIVTDESAEAGSLAHREMVARELEQKKQLEQDRQILEESQQLAAERAEYREAHPAYQGGRIS